MVLNCSLQPSEHIWGVAVGSEFKEKILQGNRQV